MQAIFRIFALSVCFAVGAASGARAAVEMKMTVEQLVVFVRSSIQLKHEDRKLADYLRKVKLVDQLDESTIEELQGIGAKPKTMEVLRELREHSKDLQKAPEPSPKPLVRSIPPPDSIEQKRILDGVRKYALSYDKSLPDFLCTQVTRRFVDPTGLEFWRTQDIVTARLGYFEQKEDYKVVLVNNQPVDVPIERLSGATSRGEFGSMLKGIFDPGSDTRFEWERWATLRGKRMHVFSYHVDMAHSKWRIDYERREEIVPAYRGLIYVEQDTPIIRRITLEAEDIPLSFPVQQAATILDYDDATIGDRAYVLPLRAVVRMRSGKYITKNEVEFRMYRKFGTESTITYTPDPLPEDKTKEQPPK